MPPTTQMELGIQSCPEFQASCTSPIKAMISFYWNCLTIAFLPPLGSPLTEGTTVFSCLVFMVFALVPVLGRVSAELFVEWTSHVQAPHILVRPVLPFATSPPP